ncbi:copper-binding protein, plastocyanin/azurin family [Roseivivax halodurans JCM 10272]|uniref:Copper-binding protein, plastocyanin/azurin family n=1 Tax=Roseivivax halodurans JCM 10272 TaxID=1449350 RepID=X7EDI0_9RHOB|nr:hypothetical protein [Roseivivax halodurans]ETX13982.1 copper-binding protein, plastocyanin/azurin family [Roseivivax halodurans JCM 10272]
MSRLIKAAPLLAAALAAPAFAAEHEVIIVRGGYFPETIYAAPGDTIRFVNAGGATATIAATDGSWASDLIDVDATATIPVVEGMTKAYSRPASQSTSGEAAVGYIEWEVPVPSGDAG